MSSEGYLSHLDRKLGFPVGTIYRLCKEARNTKTSELNECRVTYKGLTESAKVRAGSTSSVTKDVFLIERNITGGGRKVLAQVFLSVPEPAREGSTLVVP
ncbi:MAG: hypothetical protein HYU39_02235 [Thaumarchaeota archaeon]|nr:hypothetical protein [Nitrososphaerota archaeon]